MSFKSFLESLSDWFVGSVRYWALYLIIILLLGICTAHLPIRSITVVSADPEKIAESVVREIKAEGYLTKQSFLERIAGLEAGLDDALDEVPPRVHEWIKAQGFLTEEAFLRHIENCSPLPAGSDCGGTASPAILPQLPLPFENAKLAPRQSPDESWRLSLDSKGVRLTPAHEIALNTFVQAFTPCAKVEGRPVQVRVVGYASTRQFVDQDGRPLPNSDALNLQAANLRARGVVSYLRNSVKGFGIDQGFNIDHEPWKSFDGMQRPFVDRSEALQGTEQEALNRSVVVQVHDAGGCQ